MKLIISSNAELLALVQRILPLVTVVEVDANASKYPTVTADIAKMFADGNKIQAIKLYKDRHGLSLYDAKTGLEQNHNQRPSR